jgi:hypothetical protein
MAGARRTILSQVWPLPFGIVLNLRAILPGTAFALFRFVLGCRSRIAKVPLRPRITQENALDTLLVIFLIILLVALMPKWPYSRTWGYGPAGIAALVLVIVLFFGMLARI